MYRITQIITIVVLILYMSYIYVTDCKRAFEYQQPLLNPLNIDKKDDEFKVIKKRLYFDRSIICYKKFRKSNHQEPYI